MELTVKELFHDAVLYDVPLMAHAVYYAAEKGFVQWGDPGSRIPYKQFDHEVIARMRDENGLRMCTVKLFVVPMAGRRYAVYLAGTEGEVKALHWKYYGVDVRRVMDVSGKMDASVHCEETGKWQSFWELKWQAVEFPFFVGEM